MKVKEDLSDVLVGIAIHSYGHIIPEAYFNHLALIAKCSKLCSIALIGLDGEKTADARERIVEKAMGYGCSHLMFVDTDHIMPLDSLNYLISNDDADIVSGVVCKKGSPYVQVGFLRTEDKKSCYHINLPLDGKSYLVDYCAMGCTLFDIKVFEKLERPWWRDTCVKNEHGKYYNRRSDMNLFDAAREAGFKIRIDTRVEVIHLADNKKIVPSEHLNLSDEDFMTEEEKNACLL